MGSLLFRQILPGEPVGTRQPTAGSYHANRLTRIAADSRNSVSDPTITDLRPESRAKYERGWEVFLLQGVSSVNGDFRNLIPDPENDACLHGVCSLPARTLFHSGSGAQAYVKLPGGLQEFPVLPDGQHAAESVTQKPDIFYDNGIRLDFHNPLGGEIAKDIFDIPRVTHAAGDGKPEVGEHPVMLLHLVENGMDFRQEKLFASVRPQGDDAGNDIGKVRQNGRHEHTSGKISPVRPVAKSFKNDFIR
jgi:hypothetical protein